MPGDVELLLLSQWADRLFHSTIFFLADSPFCWDSSRPFCVETYHCVDWLFMFCGFFSDVFLPLLMPKKSSTLGKMASYPTCFLDKQTWTANISLVPADNQFVLQDPSCFQEAKNRSLPAAAHMLQQSSWPILVLGQNVFFPNHRLVISYVSCIQGGRTGQCTQSEMPLLFLCPLYMFLWIWHTVTIYNLYS